MYVCKKNVFKLCKIEKNKWKIINNIDRIKTYYIG